MANEFSAGVAAFVGLLGVALIVSIVAERIRVPAAVLLVAAGAAAGSMWHLRPPFAFGPVVFFVFLPPLIFEAAWNIDLTALRAHASRIAILAVPGTLLSAFAVAGALAITGALPFASALIFGAIISATDPVAVVAVFRNAAVPAGLKTIVEAESISNDGVAVVLYGAALVLAQGGNLHWLSASAHGALEVFGGILIGTACAFPLWRILRATKAVEYEVTATIALAYVAYLAADRLGWSGIFATAAAAITLRALLGRAAFMHNRDEVDSFWNSAAYVSNATVFIATGLLIDIPRAMHEPIVAIAAIAAIALSRAVLSLIAGADIGTRVTVFLAGMRGALPLALALALPPELPYRATIIDGVFAVVLVTLVFAGVALQPVVTKLFGKTPG